MKSTEELFEEFHTEIMAQTSRGCTGSDFTHANKIYKEFCASQYRMHLTAFGAFCAGLVVGGFFTLVVVFVQIGGR